ncbi:MAG: glycosyltransferase family 4 protein [Thiothrix sp.]|uniref:glycosyltransferase family 4 protein n=1 Tax=Thiothrix sp. TaxID=1032 RepID=UPI00260EAB57|nr:glycosyltransferase family 4 protein [Thiothrix sp.]MDD5394635.1 glycosyltransferase family 4 protein [Thiothrix sp.]
MQSFRLAIVRQHYRPDGGAERIIQRMLDGFGRSLDVSIVTQGWQVPADSGLQVIPVRKRGWSRSSRFRHFVTDVQAVLLQQRFDLVQSHERVPGCQVYRAGDGVHAEWLRIRAEYQLGTLGRWWQGVDPFHRAVLAAEADMFAHSALQKVVCISERGRQDILRHYPMVDPGKLVLVYNGIDLEKHMPSPLDVQARVKVAWGYAAVTPVAMFVGSGFERKGLAVLLQALAQTTDWHLVVVGKDKYQRNFERAAQQLGIASRVRFVGMQTNMNECYALADLLVHPAWYEPFGNVVLEAMAHGRGVLVSSQCGSGELVRDGQNGYVFHAGDAQQLASLLESCKDRTVLETLGADARRTAEQYPIARMVGTLVDTYRSLLAGI